MLTPFFLFEAQARPMLAHAAHERHSRPRRFLIWSLTALTVLAGAPSASARFGISAYSTFVPVTKVSLGLPDELTLAEKEKIEAINRLVPANPGLVIAAPRFSLSAMGADPLAAASALDCMTAAIYFEAATEPITGQRAVAQVILNRLRHPAFPDSVCDVVFEGSERSSGCQFTFTCDGSLGRTPSPALWSRARLVAGAALGGFVETSVGHATHYHATYVLPYWAPRLEKLTTIGSHIFYQWQGGWARPSAFTDRYAMREVLPPGPQQALPGYWLSPATPGVGPLPAQAGPAGTDFATTPTRAAPQTVSGMAEPTTRQQPVPSTALIVAKSELIDTRARLKDDLQPAAAMHSNAAD